MSRARKILIAGYYGFGNVGDEAILSAIMTGLREQRQDIEFLVVSANPPGTMADHKVQAIDWKDVDGLLNAGKESDLIILGGGGLFQDYWGVPEGVALTPSHWGISYYSAIGMLAVLYQKPFMIYSVGVGPVISEEGRRLTRWTFDLANACTVRDPESKDLLVSLGVEKEKIVVTPDPVLALSADTDSAAEILQARGIDAKAPPLLGVCLRNWGADDKTAGEWKKELAAALDQFLETHDAQVIFIPFQIQEHTLENDHSVALDVLSMMRNKNQVCALPESYHPPIMGGLISRCQLILGMRLHSLVFAASAGIPAVALVYDPKVDQFMRSLDMSQHELDLTSMTGEGLATVLEAAWMQQKIIRQSLRTRVEKLKKLAKKTPNMALKLLAQGSKTQFSMEVLQALAIEQTRAHAEKEKLAQTLSAELSLSKQQVQKLQDHVAAQQHELNEILLSKSWRLAQAFRRMRLLLVPVGGRREQLARWLYRSARNFSYRISQATTAIRQAIHRHGLLLTPLRGLRFLSIRLYYANKNILHRGKFQQELEQLETVISQHTGFFDVFHVPMGWNTLLFQRFQHMSLQTAKLGGLALYGGHPAVDRGILVYQKAADNLYVFDATNRQIVERVFQVLESKDQPRLLRIQSIDLVTTAEDVDRFIQNGFIVLYEYIDEINPHITGQVPDSVYRRHAALLKDERVMVICTSDQLFETVQRHRTRNLLLSTNGVDLEHWRIPKGEPPEDLKPALNGNLVIGYHGALAQWMEYDLLRRIADEGSYELVLIGHEHDHAFAESGLNGHPRVHFLGAKTYATLNTYAVHYDIAILPFKKTALTQAVSPVKIFEYMAARKPIVTTDLRECKKYRSCLVAESHTEFMEQLKHAAGLRTDSDYLRLLDQQAFENSWEKKTVEILRLAGVQV